MASSQDPEVTELTQTIRSLTGQARELSQHIEATLAELTTFRDEVATLTVVHPDRRSPTPGVYTGQERRRP